MSAPPTETLTEQVAERMPGTEFDRRKWRQAWKTSTNLATQMNALLMALDTQADGEVLVADVDQLAGMAGMAKSTFFDWARKAEDQGWIERSSGGVYHLRHPTTGAGDTEQTTEHDCEQPQSGASDRSGLRVTAVDCEQPQWTAVRGSGLRAAAVTRSPLPRLPPRTKKFPHLQKSPNPLLTPTPRTTRRERQRPPATPTSPTATHRGRSRVDRPTPTRTSTTPGSRSRKSSGWT